MTSHSRGLPLRPYTESMNCMNRFPMLRSFGFSMPRSFDGSMLRSFAGKAALVSSSLLAFTVAPAVLTTPAAAQQRGPVQRVVQGKVTDQANGALKGAVVYLKDDHTLSVKSFIADDQGEYRFGQLAQNTDYEIWAEHDGKKSAVKTISSFDSKNQFFINLKIDTAK